MESLTEIQKLYQRFPKTQCREGCTDCCYDIIQVALEEEERMGGNNCIEKCMHLNGNQCNIHENRPLTCRLYGASELFKCS